MNMRKAAAAAFGAALLSAGTGTVVAHGLLSSNSTGAAHNKNSANAGTSSASCDVCSAQVDATFTASSVVGVHDSGGRNHQKLGNKTKSGHANGSTHGSAKSGSQSFRIK